MTILIGPRQKGKICNAMVNHGRTHVVNCRRKPKVHWRGVWWCGTHAPDAVQRRETKREAQYRTGTDLDDAKWKVRTAEQRVVREAKRLIKKGYAGDKIRDAIRSLERREQQLAKARKLYQLAHSQ